MPCKKNSCANFMFCYFMSCNFDPPSFSCPSFLVNPLDRQNKDIHFFFFFTWSKSHPWQLQIHSSAKHQAEKLQNSALCLWVGNSLTFTYGWPALMGIYPSGHPPMLSSRPNCCYYVFVVILNKLSLCLSRAVVTYFEQIVVCFFSRITNGSVLQYFLIQISAENVRHLAEY